MPFLCCGDYVYECDAKTWHNLFIKTNKNLKFGTETFKSADYNVPQTGG